MSSGNDLNFFVDEVEVFNLVDNVCDIHNLDVFPTNYRKLESLLQKYQEQPSLLNTSMLSMMTKFTSELTKVSTQFQSNLFTNSDEIIMKSRMTHFHNICQTVQLLCRVRGFKNILKYFTHEVSHLEMCLYMLGMQDKNDYETWPTRYVLLIWLSFLNSIPFNICSLDSSYLFVSQFENLNASSSLVEGSKRISLVENILHTCCDYLSDAGLTREAAGHCIAVLLSRPDMQNHYVHLYISYCQDLFLKHWLQLRSGDTRMPILECSSSELSKIQFPIKTIHNYSNESVLISHVIGVLNSIAQLFKRGDRIKLLIIALNMLKILLLVSNEHLKNQTTLRKLATKVIGKIGMILLPPKEAAWRYARGKRSLMQNLTEIHNTSVANHSLDIEMEQSRTAYQLDYCDEVEEIVDYLLRSLRDKDTVVRWSAAKHVGRLAMRLSPLHVDDIIQHVIAIFEDELESDSCWHGGCLALAELARRNLISPFLLQSSVIDIIKRAIVFDVMKGHNSIGSNVRDAGCYLCWSLGHAYDPSTLAPYIHELGCLNLITAVFDREINCRRAASAAFQENIGRQGALCFPHGLEIMAIADYHSLGNRTAAYLDIAPSIAKFDTDLYIAFQYHLRYRKLVHWDEDVRSLASKSLANLVPLNRKKSIQLLTDLLPDCFSNDVFKRHGCLLGLSEILFSLYVSNFTIGSEYPTENVLTDIINVVPKLFALRLYRGRGAEMLRIASCYLIEKISICNLCISNKVQVSLLEALNDNLKQPHKNVQSAAKSALRQFVFMYFGLTPNKSPSTKLLQASTRLYVEGLYREENVAITRGYAQAIGVMPLRLVGSSSGFGSLQQLFSCISELVGDSTPTPPSDDVTSLVLSALQKDSAVIAAGNIAVDNPTKVQLTPVASDAAYMNKKTASSATVGLSMKPTKAVLASLKDVETRVYLIDAIPELLEKSEYMEPLTTDALISILNILFHGCDDYTTDNRGDVGSWVRMASLLALERGLYYIERHYRMSDELTLSNKSQMTYTQHTVIPAPVIRIEYDELTPVMGSLGLAFMSSTSVCDSSESNEPITELQTLDSNLLKVKFPCMSCGFILSPGRMDINKTPANAYACNFVSCENKDDSVTKVISISNKSKEILNPIAYSKLIGVVTACISVLLKQLGEKLDVVRSTAGNILLRLFNIAYPDENHCTLPNLIPEYTILRFQMCDLMRTADSNNQSYSNEIDWTNADVVYPFLCGMYRSSEIYKTSIISGMVISIGCINEKISKVSRSSFIDMCKHDKSLHSNQKLSSQYAQSVYTLLDILSKLFVQYQSVDRVIVPLIKTVEAVVNSGLVTSEAFQLLQGDYATQGDLNEISVDTFSMSTQLHLNELSGVLSVVMDRLEAIFNCVKTELSRSSDVIKIKLCCDLLILFLIGYSNNIRYNSMRTLVMMLGHKFAVIRKHVAENLYIHFLTDTSIMSDTSRIFDIPQPLNNNDSKTTANCCFFLSPIDYTEAMTLLTVTPWEDSIATARVARSKMYLIMGLESLESRNLEPADTVITGGYDSNGKSTQRTCSESKGIEAARVAVDSLSSYSSLVRDAGR